MDDDFHASLCAKAWDWVRHEVSLESMFSPIQQWFEMKQSQVEFFNILTSFTLCRI